MGIAGDLDGRPSGMQSRRTLHPPGHTRRGSARPPLPSQRSPAASTGSASSSAWATRPARWPRSRWPAACSGRSSAARATSPRTASGSPGPHVRLRPVRGRARHRHVRGDQQDRRDADLVPLVGRAGLCALGIPLPGDGRRRAPRLVDRRPPRRRQPAGRVLPAPDRRRDDLGRGPRGHAALPYTEAAEPWKVVGGSLGMAFFVCIAAGVLGSLGLRVRL